MGARDVAFGGAGGGDEGSATFDVSTDTPVVTSLTVEDDATVGGDLAVAGALAVTGDTRVTGALSADEIVVDQPRNCRVTLAGDFTVTATPAKVPFDTETFDPAGVHSSGRFTPGQAGYYELRFRLITVATGGSTKTIDVRKNGTSYAKFAIPSAVVLCDEYSTQVLMDADDYLEIFASIGTGTVAVKGDSTNVGSSEASLRKVLA